MTLNKWVKTHLGKYVKYNKYTSGYQCVDLAKSYCVEVFDFFKRYPELEKSWAWGDARKWYENYSYHRELTENFTRISNSPSFIPIAGDICIFTEHNKQGHICVAYDNKSTTSKIYTIDQNYNPAGSKVKYCTHRYGSEGFLGVLRPKDRKVWGDVNVRSKPSMSADIIGEIRAGDTVNIIELDSTKKWARIGKSQWISYKFINEVGEE